MTPERWAQLEDLFHRAWECEHEERETFLNNACRADLDLRRQVEALLVGAEEGRDHLQAAIHEQLETVGFPLVDETVSHYRILEGLAAGGMGLVYRAEDIKLGRQVALKFLLAESAKDAAALARFEREARAASALEHPNICPIYEFGEHQGQPFLVMQLLEGMTLRELLSAAKPRTPPLAAAQVLDLAVQIADGLEAAHQRGIVHRDIKPTNIFITKQGQARILDFGLAKLIKDSRSSLDALEPELAQSGETAVGARITESQETSDPLLSRAGMAMGTAAYMSPEQARGEPLDARTDIFSFGLVLYELATGQPAFRGETRLELHDAILYQVPTPPRRINDNLPARLDRILLKALEKERSARFQSMTEMRSELAALKKRFDSKHPVYRWAMVSGFVVLLAAAAAIMWRQPPAKQSIPNIEVKQLTTNPPENQVIAGVISPDGKYLGYNDAKGIHIKAIEANQVVNVSKPEELRDGDVNWELFSSSWFPDSTKFVVNAHPASERPSDWSSQTSSIWVVPTSGGSPQKLRDNSQAWSVSPNGLGITFGTNRGHLGERELWLTTLDGRESRKLIDVSDDRSLCCSIFFPGERRIAYISSGQFGDTYVARDLEGGPIVNFLSPAELKKMGDFILLPGGKVLYSDPWNFISTRPDTPSNFWMERVNPHTAQVIEKPTRLTNWVGGALSNPSVTQDGNQVAFLKSKPSLASYVAELAFGGIRLLHLRQFPVSDALEAVADWTPDSRQLIVVNNSDGHYGVYRQPLDQDAVEPIVKEGYGRNPRVTPGGKYLLYLGRTENGGPIGVAREPVMRVSLVGGPSQLLFIAKPWSLISCARGSSGICAIGEPSENRKQLIITTLDPQTGRGSELLSLPIDPNENGWHFDLSKDGSRLAIIRSPTGPIEVFSAKGRPLLRIKPKGWSNVLEFSWAADGKGLFVVVGVKTKHVLLYVNLQGSAIALWENPGASGETIPIPSPDGRHLAIQTWSASANMWLMENF